MSVSHSIILVEVRWSWHWLLCHWWPKHARLSVALMGLLNGTYQEIHWITQTAITCSKLTIDTLEQGVKYIQSYKDTRTTPMNIFHTLSRVSHLAHRFKSSTCSHHLLQATPSHYFGGILLNIKRRCLMLKKPVKKPSLLVELVSAIKRKNPYKKIWKMLLISLKTLFWFRFL